MKALAAAMLVCLTVTPAAAATLPDRVAIRLQNAKTPAAAAALIRANPAHATRLAAGAAPPEAGGLRLAAPPDEISIGAVVRKMEGDFALVECLPGGNGQCIISSACRLTSILAEALEAFLQVLDGYTIDDLCGENPKLAKILSMRAA